MPHYDYRCPACGNEQTYKLSFQEYATTESFPCKKCGETLKRVFREFSFNFKQ